VTVGVPITLGPWHFEHTEVGPVGLWIPG